MNKHNTLTQIKLAQATIEDGAECSQCGELYSHARRNLGYLTCCVCGELSSRKVIHTIVPIPKSNYVYAASAADVVSPYSHKGNR